MKDRPLNTLVHQRSHPLRSPASFDFKQRVLGNDRLLGPPMPRFAMARNAFNDHDKSSCQSFDADFLATSKLWQVEMRLECITNTLLGTFKDFSHVFRGMQDLMADYSDKYSE